jgi:hypothetical protein
MMNPFQENGPKPMPKKRLMEEEEEAEHEAELEKAEKLRQAAMMQAPEVVLRREMSLSDYHEIAKKHKISVQEFGEANTVLAIAKELLKDVDLLLENMNDQYEKVESEDVVDRALKTLISLCPEQQKEVETTVGKGAYRTSQVVVLEPTGPRAKLEKMRIKRAASVKPRRVSPKLRVLQGWRGRLLAALMLFGSSAANIAALQHMVDTGVDRDVDAFLGLPGGRGHE